MESDLISRRALLDAIEEIEWYHISEVGTLALGAHSEDDGLYRATDIYNAFDKAPTIDAVEVVRCKDCKMFAPCEEVDGQTWTGFCKYGQFHTDEDDFCSRGERREENATD